MKHFRQNRSQLQQYVGFVSHLQPMTHNQLPVGKLSVTLETPALDTLHGDKFTSIDKTKLSVAQLVGYQTTKSVEKCKVRISITLPIEIFPSHVFVTNACHLSLKIWLLNDRFMVLFDASSFAPFSGLSQLHLSASTLCKLEAPELKGC